MKVAASVMIAAAALGVSARPSGHAHLHQERDYVVANAPTTTTTAYAVAATTSTAASSSSSSGSSSEYKEFCTSSTSNSKRATSYDIASVGNVGSPYYGCNIMEVGSDITSKYDYTATFTNEVDEDQACVCWNKIGPTGKIDGMWKGNQAMNFTLPASGTAAVAFQADSQGGCACSVGSEPAYTSLGQFASTWFEFDFCSTKNSGWSGADASALVPLTYSLDVTGLKVCLKGDDSACSIIGSGNSGSSNSYDSLDTVSADGIGYNLNTDTVHFAITVSK